MMQIRLLIAAVTLALASAAPAQEWTRFRGPNGSGVGKAALPDQIGERDIVWRATLPGSGHSSPVVFGERIFVTCTPDASQAPVARRSVVCVSAKDGKLAWQREYSTGGYRKHADNSFASPSCAVDDAHVYAWFAGPDGSVLVALTQAEGREVWKRELGAFTSMHGAGASPIVEHGMVVLQSSQDGPGSFVQAFEPATGKTVWKIDIASGQHAISTPCSIIGADGKPQLVSLSDGGMLGIDPTSGKKLWELVKFTASGYRCVASPVILDGGLIMAQTGQGQANSEIAVIRNAGMGKPEKAYDIVRTGGYVPMPVAAGDLVFLWKENGLVTCVRAATNEQLWSERVEGPYYASPVCVGGKGGRLYNVTRGGELVVIEAGEKFRLIQRFPLGEKNSYASPALAGGRLYVRTFTQLIAIGK
jgi:outer membrane protein assembly factor BamB